MEQWKVNQHMYARLVKEHSDASDKFVRVDDEDVIGRAVEYLTSKPHFSHYPGKQYAVSIVYAYLISEHFGGDVREILNDPELLLNPAYPHTPYSQDPTTYDKILEVFLSNEQRLEVGWVPYTKKYWMWECTDEGIGALMLRLSDTSKPTIDLSINVSYYCNLRCEFCYLTNKQLGDKTLLPLDDLKRTIQAISDKYEIRHVDFYGGEIALIPVKYFNDMVEMVKTFDPFDMRLTTNLTVVNEIVMHPEVHLYVSYDFSARAMSDRVAKNMKELERPFTILTLATEVVTATPIGEVVEFYSSLKNLVSVEVKPYNNNQANVGLGNGKGFYDLVSNLISYPGRMFTVENESLLLTVLDGTRNAFSNEHLFITPQNKLSVLGFDVSGREFFLEFDDVSGYSDWCGVERTMVNDSSVCGKCRYKGTCLTEHYQVKEPTDGYCSGHLNLIKWFDGI